MACLWGRTDSSVCSSTPYVLGPLSYKAIAVKNSLQKLLLFVVSITLFSGCGRSDDVNDAGQAEARAAKTLDDSDGTDLVVGADSGEQKFGHTFRGLIHDVHLYSRAFSQTQVRAIFDLRGRETRTREQ